MDERLHAGRHHLLNGEKALQDGYLDDSRSHFEAALLQFRGPELRLGEAHALRGLARVELGCGNLRLAEGSARAAILQYQEVRAVLERVDTEGVSTELWRDAEEGEGAALVLLSDLLLRAGRREEARSSLASARDLFSGLGEIPSAAGVWLAIGRLNLRDGRFDDAGSALRRAVDINARSGDVGGECHGWLGLSEAHRLQGAFDKAEEALDKAVSLARGTHHKALLGRALSQLGSLMLQLRRFAEARSHYQEALPLIRESGDVEMEGFARVGLGDVMSRLGDADALPSLVEGARLLGSLDNQHGLGTAMLRLSDHALRVGEPGMALAAAESARQLWYALDPVRGGGQALRLVVKALAALEQWPAVVTAAHLRAVVAGHVQPNAVEVRDFYRRRAPEPLLQSIDALTPERLETRTEALISDLLEPLLEPLDLDPLSLATVGGALAVVEAVLELGPLAPQSVPADTGPESTESAASADARPADPAPTLQDAPPEEVRPDAEVPVPAASEAVQAPHSEPAPALGYEGLYDPPEATAASEKEEPAAASAPEEPGAASEPQAEPVTPDPAAPDPAAPDPAAPGPAAPDPAAPAGTPRGGELEDVSTETFDDGYEEADTTDAVVADLQRQPVPDDYSDWYQLPDDDDDDAS